MSQLAFLINFITRRDWDSDFDYDNKVNYYEDYNHTCYHDPHYTE